MIIRSLCYFPPTKGLRSPRAARSIRKVLNGFRFRLITISLAAFAMQSLPLLIPLAFQRYLPILMEEPDPSRMRLQALGNVVALAVTVAALRSLATYYFLKEAGRTGHQLVASLRELAYAQLMRLPVRYVERRGAGRILLRFIGDTDALRSWFSKTGPKLVADCVTGALITCGLIWLSWTLSLVLVVPLSLAGLTVAAFSQSIRQKTGLARGRQAQFTGFLQTQLSDIRSSKLADARDSARTELRSRIAEVALLNADRDRDAAKLEALAQLAIYTGLPLLILTGLPLVWSSRLQPSELIVFVWLTLHLIVLVRSSPSAFVLQQKALVSIQRIYVLLARSAEGGRSGKSVKSRFERLSVAFNGQRHDFSRGIHQLPEEVDAARLLDALHGFERPTELTLAIDDTPIDQIDVRQRRRRIGGTHAAARVPQPASGKEFGGLRIVVLDGWPPSWTEDPVAQRQLEQLAESAIVLSITPATHPSHKMASGRSA
jgi:ABC-type multidrug transport system fused ATPase/permease subunit